jgi:hypothetical protein
VNVAIFIFLRFLLVNNLKRLKAVINRIVAKLVRENMPQLSFESTLTSLHGDVRKMLPLILAEE